MDCSSKYAMWAAFASAGAAVFSAFTGFRNFKLAKSIQDDARADERIVVGKLAHPALEVPDHRQAVLVMPVFNKSKRKVAITDLVAQDHQQRPIEVAWGTSIDRWGNVQDRLSNLVIVDEATIYIRRNDGKGFDFCCVVYRDSFSSLASYAVFDPAAELMEQVR